MKILANSMNNVIVAISNEITKEINGYLIDKVWLVGDNPNNPMYTLHTTDNVPVDIKPATHCYDGVSFTVNSEYKQRPMQQQEIEQQLVVMQKAIDDIILRGGTV